jgi:hypothetical protein
LELIPGLDEPGCPWLYQKKYVHRKKMPEFAWQLDYGSAIHGALQVMEEEMIDPLEALKRVWPAELGPERFDEAMRDLRAWLENPDDLHTIATEQDLTAVLYEDEDFGVVKIGGRIDRIAIDGVNPSVIYFDDYKTDRRPPSYKALNRWIQGYFYASILKANAHRYMPDQNAEVVGRYEAVKWYRLQKVFTDDDLEVFLAWAESIARRILRDKKPEPVLNPGCGWCPIRVDCAAWQALPGEGTGLLERMAKLPLEKRVAEWDEVKSIARRLDQISKETEAAVKDKVAAEGAAVEMAGIRWSLANAERRWADPRQLHQIMGDAFYDTVRVTLGDVDTFKEDHPELGAKIEKAIGLIPANPKLKGEPVDS